MSKQEPTFEQAMAQLEELVDKLESDDLSLDDALAHFEKGIALMRRCEGYLKGAEGKLRELLKGENGEFIEKTLGISPESLASGEDTDE